MLATRSSGKAGSDGSLTGMVLIIGLPKAMRIMYRIFIQNVRNAMDGDVGISILCVC